MMLNLSGIYLFVVLCLPAVALPPDPPAFTLSASVDEYRSWVDVPVNLFEDTGNRYSYKDIRRLSTEGAFEMFQGRIPKRRYSSSAFWYHIRIQSDDADEKWYLRIPYVDEAVLYFDSSDSLRTGAIVPMQERPIKHNMSILPLDSLYSSPRDIYVRVKSSQPMPANIVVFHESKLLPTVLKFNLWVGIVIGIYFGLAIYHVFLALFTRDRIFATTVVFLILIALHALYNRDRAAWADLWPGGGYWTIHGDASLFALAIASLMQLSREFLKTSGVEDLILKILLWLGLGYGLTGLFYYSPFLASSGVTVCMAAMFILALIALKKLLQHNRFALYYLLVWLPFFIGFAVGGLYWLGFYTMYEPGGQAMESGLTISVVLLSLVIGFRYNSISKEREFGLIRNARLEREHNETRYRILANLHDEANADLSAIVQISELTRSDLPADSSEARSIDKISRVARRLTGSMREIIWGIDPQKDTGTHLLSKMRDTADELLINIPHRFEIPDRYPAVLFAPTVKIELLRIYKEALHNIVKHAQASMVRIKVDIDEELTLRIEDNGVGLPADYEEGNGMRGMKQRADRIRASLNITNGLGGGVQVVCTVKMTQVRPDSSTTN